MGTTAAKILSIDAQHDSPSQTNSRDFSKEGRAKRNAKNTDRLRSESHARIRESIKRDSCPDKSNITSRTNKVGGLFDALEEKNNLSDPINLTNPKDNRKRLFDTEETDRKQK